MNRYIVTARAEIDITEILLYIAADNPDAALQLKDRFDEVFEMLLVNPRAGRERAEISSGLRSFPVGNYLVFYRLWASDIGIIRLTHAARDLDAIFS